MSDMSNTPAGQHVVLGGTGVVGRETVGALSRAGAAVTAVSRTAGAHAGSITADLRDPAAVRSALNGAAVAYLTAGLPYSSRAWRCSWPAIVRATIDACVTTGTHLVYFDNVYAYGRTDEEMTEQTPLRPTSKKGQVRADALRELQAAVDDRGLVCTIGRSADFYGPRATTSVFNRFVIDKVARGRSPVWLYNAGLPHSMTYTPDIGSALAVLGTDSRATGHTWHLPTAPALTGEEYLTLAGQGAKPHKTMTDLSMRIGAIFSRQARETIEMAYQYQRPYRLCSAAFERAFDVRPTPYHAGIAASLDAAQVRQGGRGGT